MSGLLRVPLEGGGSFLARVVDQQSAGPVRAGRVGDRIADGAAEASETLQTALAPVVAMSRALLDRLAEAGPRSLEVEFGIELTAEAGAVITKTAAACHLTVTLTWDAEQARGRAADQSAG